MRQGTPKFDGLTVAEINAVFTGGLSVETTFAFVNTRTGASHGWTKMTTASPKSIDLLKALAASLEEDAAKQHFDEGSDTTATAVTQPTSGLGELLANAAKPL